MKILNKFRMTATLSLVASFAHGTPSDIRDIAAAILPVPLVAEYSCGAYAEMVLRPMFVTSWSPRLNSSPSQREVLTAALTEYAGLMRPFCADVLSTFKGKEAFIATIYARALPGFADEMGFLSSAQAVSWLKRETDFLRRSVVLLNVYSTAKRLAPGLLDQQTPGRVTKEEYEQIEGISVGMVARQERFSLLTLLRDEGFSLVVPKDFDLAGWRAEEQQLREEGSRRSIQMHISQFNNNANDFTRRLVLDFDYEPQLGLALVTERYKPIFGGIRARK